MDNYKEFTNVSKKDGLPLKIDRMYKVKWKDIRDEFMLMLDSHVISSWRINVKWWYDDDGTKHVVNVFKPTKKK